MKHFEIDREQRSLSQCASTRRGNTLPRKEHGMINLVFLPMPRTTEELAAELKSLRYNTIIHFNNWAITQGFWGVATDREGKQVKARKLWLTNLSGRTRSILASDHNAAAQQIADIVLGKI